MTTEHGREALRQSAKQIEHDDDPRRRLEQVGRRVGFLRRGGDVSATEPLFDLFTAARKAGVPEEEARNLLDRAVEAGEREYDQKRARELMEGVNT